MAGGSRFGMVESEWSKVECKRAAHRALSESVVSVMSLRRERELSGGVERGVQALSDFLAHATCNHMVGLMQSGAAAAAASASMAEVLEVASRGARGGRARG